MTDKIICEKCGSEMNNRSSEGSIFIECPKCGWGWATTVYDATAEDDTSYEVWLLPGNPKTQKILRLIAGLANVNFLQAREMLNSETPVLLYKAVHEAVAEKNKVQRIQEIAKVLQTANIRFSISPDFPYTF